MQREEKYITRGVGYSWTELKPKPGLNLFGGGGEIDGPVATITDSHAENVQEEEARHWMRRVETVPWTKPLIPIRKMPPTPTKSSTMHSSKQARAMT